MIKKKAPVTLLIFAMASLCVCRVKAMNNSFKVKDSIENYRYDSEIINFAHDIKTLAGTLVKTSNDDGKMFEVSLLDQIITKEQKRLFANIKKQLKEIVVFKVPYDAVYLNEEMSRRYLILKKLWELVDVDSSVCSVQHKDALGLGARVSDLKKAIPSDYDLEKYKVYAEKFVNDLLNKN